VALAAAKARHPILSDVARRAQAAQFVANVLPIIRDIQAAGCRETICLMQQRFAALGI
jgi:hypothetical protein